MHGKAGGVEKNMGESGNSLAGGACLPLVWLACTESWPSLSIVFPRTTTCCVSEPNGT